MTTLFLTIISVSSILLITGFILLYREPEQKENRSDHSVIIEPYKYNTFSEMSGKDKEEAMEEAEKEHTVKTPLKEDNQGIDIENIGEQISIAKDSTAKPHLRLRAGKYLSQYESLPFIEELISRLSPEEQNTIYETLKMTKDTICEGEKPWYIDLQQL